MHRIKSVDSTDFVDLVTLNLNVELGACNGPIFRRSNHLQFEEANCRPEFDRASIFVPRVVVRNVVGCREPVPFERAIVLPSRFARIVQIELLPTSLKLRELMNWL